MFPALIYWWLLELKLSEPVYLSSLSVWTQSLTAAPK